MYSVREKHAQTQQRVAVGGNCKHHQRKTTSRTPSTTPYASHTHCQRFPPPSASNSLVSLEKRRTRVVFVRSAVDGGKKRRTASQCAVLCQITENTHTHRCEKTTPHMHTPPRRDRFAKAAVRQGVCLCLCRRVECKPRHHLWPPNLKEPQRRKAQKTCSSRHKKQQQDTHNTDMRAQQHCASRLTKRRPS